MNLACKLNYTDELYLRFQESLRKYCSENSAWWTLRDTIFSLFVGYPEPSLEKRHRYGNLSWLFWAFMEVGRYHPHIDLQRIPDNAHHFIVLNTNAVHLSILSEVLRDFEKHSRIVIWLNGMPVKDISGIDHQINREICFDCSTWCRQTRSHDIITAIASASHFWKRIEPIRHEYKGHFLRPSHLSELLLRFMSFRAGIANVIETCRPISLHTTSEGPTLVKACFSCCRERGIRTFHHCHGLPWETHATSIATDICAFSKLDADWFRKRVPEQTIIHTSGNPRMARVRNEVLMSDQATTHQPLRILLLSNGVEMPYTSEHVTQDLSILRLPPEVAGGTVMRVRPHPREDREALISKLRRSGLPVESVTSGPLRSDIAWADVCATPWSTSLLEAIVCERACFWTNARNDRMVRTGDFIDAGVGTLIANSLDWTKIITSIIDNPIRAERYRLRQKRLEEVGLIPPDDGKDWYDRLMGEGQEGGNSSANSSKGPDGIDC